MREELQELTAAWLGERISQERLTVLLVRLREDPSFRTAFVAEARMFAMLRVVQSPEPRWLALQDELGIGDSSARDLAESVSARVRAQPRPFVTAFWRPIAQLAACVALGLGILFFVRPRVAVPLLSEGAAHFAVVVRAEGVVWRHDTSLAPAVNESVGREALRFTVGRLTLACLNGVTLHVEGPADLSFASLERVVCHRGNVRALVADGAEGFTIITPGAAIVDLGTEFGVKVEESGRSEVVVYQGKAEASLLAPDGSPRRSLQISAQQAVELDPRQNSIRNVAPRTLLASPDLQIPPLQLPPGYSGRVLASGPLGYWRGALKDAVISDAAGGSELRSAGSVYSASDGSFVFTPDQTAQFLRMDGTWTPTGDFAIELWFASVAFHSSVLAVLQSTTSPRGEFSMLELTARGKNSPTSPGRVRFLYRYPPGGADGVNLYSTPLYQPCRWNHLVCQRRGGQLEMYLNGSAAGITALTGSEATANCTLRFGRLFESPETPNDRQFQGSLAEMAIYERALSAEEVRSHAGL